MASNEDLKHKCDVIERLRVEMKEQLQRYITQNIDLRETMQRQEYAKRDQILHELELNKDKPLFMLGAQSSPQTLNFTELSAQKIRIGAAPQSVRGFTLQTAGAILDTTDNEEEDDEVPVFSYKLKL